MMEAHDRDTHRLRFRKDIPEGLAHAPLDCDTWSTKHAGALQPGADCALRVLAKKGRSGGKLSIQLFQCRAERAVADDYQAGLGPPLLHALHRTEQIIAALVRNQPANVKDQV